MKLLDIEACPRKGPSVTRALGHRFVEAWRSEHPDAAVIHRDLALTPPSFVDGNWIDAAFTRPSARTELQRDALAESDALIAEIASADRILISTPMYNFGLPAVVKAYFDQIVRIGVTYGVEAALLAGKNVTVICASRDVYTPGAPLESADHLSGNLREILRFVGINDVDMILVGDSIAVREERVSFDEHADAFTEMVTESATSL